MDFNSLNLSVFCGAGDKLTWCASANLASATWTGSGAAPRTHPATHGGDHDDDDNGDDDDDGGDAPLANGGDDGIY